LTHRLPLRDALCGTTLELKGVDGQILKIPVTEVISPAATKVVAGHGMPIPKAPGTRGNLVIKFVVLFPRQLSEEQREALKQALPLH
jgi:DnaJ-class molecular chaperone